MKLSQQIIDHMKECGFWEQHKMDSLSDNIKSSLATMHHFCTSEKHKLVR